MRKFRILALMLVLIMVLAGCGTGNSTPAAKDIVILYTNDAHCGIEDGMGYQGLSAAKRALLAAGNKVLLVDNGDAVQGDTIGTLSKGEYIIDIMNKLGYDVATPGNHEFDYGMDQFNKLVEKADFDYISCNFVDKDGNPVLKPYVIKEADGVKIAFVGISTPKTITTSTPTYFQDGNGNYIYGFMQDDTGEKLYAAVQSAVDAARKEGAKYVIAMAHLGIEADCQPWTSSDVIVNTSGIDVVLDGHSHSTIAGDIVKNKEGKDVILTSTGTKLANIGCLTITADGKVSSTLINDDGVGETISEIKKGYEEMVNTVVASTKVELTVNDPISGERMVRRQETNLGDLCADAYRAMSGADIAVVNGGGIRVSIPAGDITLGDILQVHPFGNALCVVEATGQQILDCLEMGASAYPGLTGGFTHVSGLTYTIDPSIPSSVKTDAQGNFSSVDGEYRVKDVKVDGKSVGAVTTYKVDKLTVSTRIEVEFTNGKLPFTDVRESDWFYEDVAFAYENGLFAGTSDTTFSPNASMTRAMLVTVLYRLEGQPAVNGRSGFSDVQYNGYYEDAVTWAADNGIVNGTSAVTFSPSENVTREQMAAILCRYAQYKQYGTSASASLSAFSDAAAVSTYAKAPLSWAVAEKLVNGTDGKLLPRASATRAQVAAILHRFVENITK